MLHRIAVLVICILISTTSFSCSTTSNTQSDDESATDATSGVDDVDREVARYAHAGSAPLVMKVHANSVDDDILPIIEPIASAIGGPQADAMISAIRDQGTLLLAGPAITGGEYLDDLDHDRPAYITRQAMGDSTYFTALEYGAVLQPDEVAPAAMHTRFLLPCDDPDAVAEKMSRVLSPQAIADVTAGEHFVRLDVVDARVESDDEGYELLDQATSLVSDIEDRRPTPVLDRFDTSDAPLSVYFRSEDLRMFFAAQMMVEAREDVAVATPDNLHRMLAMGTAAAQNALIFSPASQFEHEDTVVELRRDDAGGLVVDATNTLTEQGHAIADSIGEAQSLEDVPSLGDGAKTTADIRWNFDVADAADRVPAGPAGGESGFSNVAVVAEALRIGGLSGYLQTFFITPSFLPRIFADDDEPMPRVGHLALALPDQGVFDPTQLAVAGTVGIDRPDLGVEDVAYLNEFRLLFDQLNVKSVFANAADDDLATRLEGRAGQTASTEDREDVELSAALVSADFDLTPIFGLSGKAPIADALGDLNRLRADWRVEDDVTRQRFHLGAGTLDHPEIAAVDGFEPAAPAPTCVTDLLITTSTITRVLSGVPYDVPVEELLGHFDHYDEAAADCVAEAPDLEDDLQLARARVRFLLRSQFLTRDDIEEAEAILRAASCEIGDPVMCE